MKRIFTMTMAAAMLAACSKDDAEYIIGTSENASANSLLGDDASLAGEKYLYRKSNDGLGYRSLGADASAWPTASATGSYRLRPVAVVSVTKE